MSTSSKRGSFSGMLRPEDYRRYGPKRNNGDAISLALARFCGSGRQFSFERLVQVAADNGCAGKLEEWADRRGKGNGMLRMLLGNHLRKFWRRGVDIKVGPEVVPGLPVEKPRPITSTEPRKSVKEVLAELERQQGGEHSPSPPAPARAARKPGSHQALPDWLNERAELRRGAQRKRVT